MSKEKLKRQAQRSHGLDLVAVLSKGTPDGVELDHFRLTPVDGYQYLEPFFHKTFGDLKRLDGVYLLGDDVDSVFTYWYEQYNDETGQFEIRCDGENRVKYLNDAGRVVRGSLPCLNKGEGGGCHCGLRGRLHFRLEAIERGTGVIGRYMATTGAYNDVMHILSRLNTLKNVFSPYGVALHQIPLILERSPDTLRHSDGNGGTGESVHYMLNIEADPDFVRQTMRPKKASTGRKTNTTYLPYLQRQFENTLPAYTVADFAAHHGQNVTDYVASNRDLESVKQSIIDWVVDSGIPVRVHNIKVGRKGKSYRYFCDIGFGQVILYSTKLLKPLIDVSPFRQKQGARYAVNDDIRFVLKRNKTNDNIKVIEAFIATD